MSTFGETLSFGLAIAGIALCIGEAIAPGAHLIVLGVALLAAGLFGIFVPEAAEPLVLAGVVIGAGAATLLVYRQLDLYGGSGEKRTADSASFQGRRGFVTERVTVRGGQVELYEGGFDPTFSARSADEEPIEPETEIVVVDPGGGSVLTVAPVEEAERYLGGGTAEHSTAEDSPEPGGEDDDSDGQPAADDDR